MSIEDTVSIEDTDTDQEFYVHIDSAEFVATGVKELVLRRATGAPFPAWEPGAHIDVILPSGMVRQYSLCGPPGDRESWRIAVLREPPGRGRGGSEYIHTMVCAGGKLRISRPRNNFAFVPAQRYLFVAGGIGITPILPMIAAAERQGADWRLAYGGRDDASMAFRTELERYGGRVEFYPQNRVGLIDLDRVLTDAQPDTAVYCCGPAALIDAVEARCGDRPAGALHVERFVPKDTGPVDGDTEFEVVLAKQNRSFVIPPGQTILHTLEAAGVELLSSCQQGMCGRCELGVLDGTPDHRDSLLTPEERESNEYILICVSRCRGERLVLDL